jgi:membrane protease YdiL (CAAX protease family)
MTVPQGYRSTVADADLSWRSLVGFYLLACTVSWTCWTVAGSRASTPSVGADALDLVGSYGPAVAALVLAVRARGDGRGGGMRRTVVAGLTLVASVWVLWGSWRTALDTGASGWTLAGLAAATLLPAVVTWCWPTRARRRVGEDGQTSGPPVAGPPWTRVGWLAVALLVFPVTSVVGAVVVGLLSGSGVSLAGGTAWPADGTALASVFAATALYGGPLGEEPGWRGVALPRLQIRLSPLVAGVVVGVAWAAWHLPLQLRGAYEESMGTGWWGVGVRFVSQVAVSVIFTWIFNQSNGSLLVVVVLHTSLNNTAGYWLPSSIGFQAGVGVLATALVVIGRMYRPPVRVRT